MILSPEMADALDKQSGYQRDGKAIRRNGVASDGITGWGELPSGFSDLGYSSGGGASRFFLNAGYEQWELDWILANGLRPCGTEDEA